MGESSHGSGGELAAQQVVGDAGAVPVAVWVVADGGFDGDPAPNGAVAGRVQALAERVAASQQPASEDHDVSPEGSDARAIRLVARPLTRGGVVVAMIELDRVRELEAALSRYDLVLRATDDAVWEWDVETSRAWWNRRQYDMFGFPPETVPSYEAWAATIHPDDRTRVLTEFDRALASDALTWRDEFRFVRRDGQIGVALDRGYIERGADGRPCRMVGVTSDVTEQRAASAALAASEERFRELAAAIDEVFWLVDARTGTTIYVSPAYETVWGRSRQSIYEQASSFLDAIEPEDRGRVEREHAAEPLGGYDTIYRIRRPDGQIAWIRDRGFPIRDERGEVIRIAGVATDITTQRRLEEQLAQSQKLESIGRLAGGIAHDFNNLLTVIMTAAHFALRGLPADSAVQGDLRHVKDAAERAAKLTAQLLAFARRQVVAPTRLDLNELTRQTDRLLRRVIGEHIELVTVLAPGLRPVMADRGQIEQVLVNLAVNARDAMLDGGRLTLETANLTIDQSYAASHANLEPGDYVMLAVSDTGVGISTENLAHVFEPFFTTKQPGQGTGLGLATCYGIVRQAGGHILVYSERDHGTTFKILLPAVAPGDVLIEPQAASAPPGGSETVLFVEDDPTVRMLGVRILAEQGYRVLEAWGGWEALRLAAAHAGPIHLLITDVVMPHMSGTELARRLVEQRPEVKVLYTSGYTENAIVHHGVLEPRVSFLQKPYILETLLSKVREVLDQG